MEKKYNHTAIEKKWRQKWQSGKIFKSKEDKRKQKFYVLDMFPYPSGEGLHVGHPKGYIATDVISRYHRMNGQSVLHPMGFDAFGLPAENYAIKTKTNPVASVRKNVKRFKKQLEIIGLDYDWSREVNTTDPKYYKWTQWIFLQLFKKGLAFESYEPINWCPSCKTGLANEDVEDGKCERCNSPVEKKPMRQWVLKITDYAEKLLADLDKFDDNGQPLLDWPESIKTLQKNWIGKSQGALIRFQTIGADSKNKLQDINVFSTRIDTIFSGTFVVLAPNHEYIEKHAPQITNIAEIRNYAEKAKNISEMERTTEGRDWTGVELKGIKAINPATGEEIPVWTADFVLKEYGTGAVFADAHDGRDFYLAKKYNIPLKVSIAPKIGDEIDKKEVEAIKNLEKCYTGEGILFNSNQFNGLSSAEARPKIISWLKDKGLAENKTSYKLRDWVFSRQRYWGEPIPLIHCSHCAISDPSSNGIVPVPEKELPVILPKVKSYEPTGTGESPLAAISKWVNVKCPKCHCPAKRETNTMPQWAGSCWYYLRYEDSRNTKQMVDPQKEKYWSPVDVYVGGAEHATRHLIYARFWHKFLYDIGAVSTVEPFKKLQHVGLIMGEDGRKMSKRFGNVVNPDDIIKTYGADTLRLYEMFMGPFDQQISWNTSSIIGTRRFVERVWKIREKVSDCVAGEDLDRLIHKTIKKVSDDINGMRFNTAVSALMILVNEIERVPAITREQYEIVLKLLAPFAPHITEELWAMIKNRKSIHISSWPVYNIVVATDNQATIIIQVNGKVRGSITVSNQASDDEIKNQALEKPEIKKWITGKNIKKVIVIKGKIVSVVTE